METSRLTLRPFVDGDFGAMHAMRSDAGVARYLYGETQSPEETRRLLAQKIASASWTREGDWLNVAAVERASGATVGDVSMRWVSERDRTAEIGFIFDPRHQGKGLATEAARALLDWAFTSAGFHRVIGHRPHRSPECRLGQGPRKARHASGSASRRERVGEGRVAERTRLRDPGA